MKKFAIGFLILLALVLSLFAGLGMLNQAEQQKIDEQIAAVKSASPILQSDMESDANSQSIATQSSPIVSTSAAEDWANLMDMYFDLEGVHSQAWINNCRRLGRQHLRDWPHEELKNMVVFINEAQPFMHEFRRVLEKHRDVPVAEWWDESDERMTFRMCGNVARMIYVDGAVWHAKGNRGRAFESIMAGIRMANGLITGPDSYSKYYWAHGDTYSLLAKALQELCPAFSLSDTQVNLWFYETRNSHQRNNALKAFQVSLVREMDLKNEQTKRQLSIKGLTDALFQNSNRGKLEDSFGWLNNQTIYRKNLNDGVHRFIRATNEVQTLTPGSFHEYLENTKAESHFVFGGSMVSRALYENHMNLTLLGLLIEQHKNNSGAFPRTLNDLPIPFDASVPKDVFTETQYEYIPDDDHFRLFSLGLEGADAIPVDRHGLPFGKNTRMEWRGSEQYDSADPTAPADEVWQKLLTVVR
jgi:hypothetical protein